MTLLLPFWQRLLITIAAMLLAGYLVGLGWRAPLNSDLPSYVPGCLYSSTRA
jgi:hypothetical protein